MMQTILFTIVGVTLSSSNRLLLQAQNPWFIPIVDQQPSNPQPVNPGVGVGVGGGQQPSGPAGPASPTDPAVGGTPGVGAPVLGTPGVGTGSGVGGGQATGTPGIGGGVGGGPATGTPGVGGGVGGGVGPVTPAGPPAWTPPPIPSLTQMQQQTVMECTLPNTAIAGCAGRTQHVTNAGRNFAAKCSNVGSCAATTMEFNFQNSYVERIELIDFSEMYAGYQSTVVIDSTESLMKQYIDVMKCGKYGACMDSNIYLVGGSSMNDIQCQFPSYCQNCVIHEDCTRNPIPGALPKYICVQNKPCYGY